MFTTLAFLGSIGGYELLVLGVVALLIFGRRLPDVARNLGKGIVEFKKGLKGIENDIDQASDPPTKNIQSPLPSQSTTPDTSEQEPQQATPNTPENPGTTATTGTPDNSTPDSPDSPNTPNTSA